jgi:Anti-sigma-K factor rskA, C-terminal
MVVGAVEATPFPVETSLGRNGSTGVAAPASAAVPAPKRKELGPIVLPPRKRLSGATLAALAVVAGLIAIALGALGVGRAVTSASSDDASVVTADLSSAQRVASLLATTRATTIPLRRSGGRLALVVRADGKGALVLNGLSRAPAGRTYQAWIRAPGGKPATSAALFSGQESVVPLRVPIPPGGAVAVTVEPASGVSAPSKPLRIVATRSG